MLHAVRRRTVLVIALCGLASAAGLAGPQPSPAAARTGAYVAPQSRGSVSLEAGWRFHKGDVSGAQATGFDDSGWAQVAVPHTWNALDGQDGGSNYYRGPGWYRRHYTPPASFAGRKVWLQFDGASLVTDVWINGVHLGQHRGGFARFRFDATAALSLAEPGPAAGGARAGQDAVIAVKVDNTRVADVAPLAGDFTVDGGLYRSVSLITTDELSVRMLDHASPGVFLRQRAVSAEAARVDVTTELWNNSSTTRSVAVRTVVTDADGAAVVDVTSASSSLAARTGTNVVQPVTVTRPHRWQGTADPYLYRVTVEVRDTVTGAVTDAVSQPLGLRSTRIDADAGLFLNEKHLALHGVNKHQDQIGKGWAVTAADQVRDFDLMDEMGVNALRAAHYQHDQLVYDLADQRGYLVWTEVPLVNAITDSADFRANIAQQMRELIRQNYNHPSIAFWGTGNEQGSDNAATNATLDQLAGLVTAEDPDRFSTYAHNRADTSPLINHAELTGFNHYFGWYYDTYNDFAGWADNLHRTQPTRRTGLSEYGAGGSVVQHEENVVKPGAYAKWHPEEYQNEFHEAYWKAIETRPFLWGSFVWAMTDFAVDSRNEGDTPGRNDKGLVSYDRATRKDAFYWYKANWTDEPFVYLTSRRFTDRTVANTTVKVYGSVDNATLRVNGVPVGSAVTAADHIYRWPVTLSRGANVVTVTGVRDGISYTDSATWTLR